MMNLDLPKLVFGFCGSVAIIGLMAYMLEYGLRNAGRTKKNYRLNESPVFRIQVRQLVYLNLLVLGGAFWIIGTILFSESSKNEFLRVLNEWKGFFLFVICFFAIIDLVLNIVLLRTFFKISPEGIEGRFDFNRSIKVSVNNIRSIIYENEGWRITFLEGKIIDIPKISFHFMQDSEELGRMLGELSRVIGEQQKSCNS
jgi:hypothetical protein